MTFDLPFFQETGNGILDSALYQLVEKLNNTEFGAYAVFSEAQKAINAEKLGENASLTPSQTSEYTALRDLIVKTGDYAIEHSETIERTLSGSYETNSPFGRYLLQTNQRITANSTGIEQLFTYTEGINNDDGEYGTLSTKQYIKTGLLFYDGAVPKYGVGIGIIETNQTQGGEVIDRDTSKLLTMTADEIAFWQQAVKVAYIQSGAINFPNANITGGSIRIGGTSAQPNFEVTENGIVKIHGSGGDANEIKFDQLVGGYMLLNTYGIKFADDDSGGIDIAVRREIGETGYVLTSYVDADEINAKKYFKLNDDIIATLYDGNKTALTPDGITTVDFYTQHFNIGDAGFDDCIYGGYSTDSTHGAYGGFFQVKAKNSSGNSVAAIQLNAADSYGNINPAISLGRSSSDLTLLAKRDSNGTNVIANKFTLNGTYITSWPQGLPSVTSQYNGYTLVVASGEWAMTPLPTGGLHGFYVYGDPSGYGHYSGIFIPQNMATSATWQIADETYSISFKLSSTGEKSNVRKWQGTTDIGPGTVYVESY